MAYLISVYLVSFSPENWQKISPIFTGSREIQSGSWQPDPMALIIKSIQPTRITLKVLQWVLFEPVSCNDWIRMPFFFFFFRMPLLRINSDFLYSTQPNLKYK